MRHAISSDQDRLNEALRVFNDYRSERQTKILRGALDGNEAMVSELVRQGVKLWIRHGVTVLDRR